MSQLITSGQLKIGDDWNAITIIALSQNNPLKAVAEFVENSIDAKAKNITIIRGKENGETYLKIIDDGYGISDLTYVATHIGDSIKRQLKKAGSTGLQGEFGIGLMSFWTIGEELHLTSKSEESESSKMTLIKNNPGYEISPVTALFDRPGTELHIGPLLPGIKMLSGDKICNYLASELRNRISQSGAKIVIHDRTSRRKLLVEPRKYGGRLLHGLPEIQTPFGEIYHEIYLNEPSPENQLSLFKLGTRVIPKISSLDQFNHTPWDSPHLEGLIDVSSIQLTPGTRDGIIRDEAYENFVEALAPLEEALIKMIAEQKVIEEETASRTILTQMSRAFREALTFLPEQEYDWLHIKKIRRKANVLLTPFDSIETDGSEEASYGYPETEEERNEESAGSEQQSFFGEVIPIHKVKITPSKTIIAVEGEKKLSILALDRSGREIELDANHQCQWSIVEGNGSIKSDGIYATFNADKEPGITRISVEMRGPGKNNDTIHTTQEKGREATHKTKETTFNAECLITSTAELGGTGQAPRSTRDKKGLPGYIFINSPGELWRSHYSPEDHIIEVNKGHVDYLYASKNNKRKLRYIARLFAKDIVLFNFPELSKAEVMERMTELLLYLEENLI